MGGDGYALCLRAGAPLIDMEFVQFFPIGHLAPRLIGMTDHVGPRSATSSAAACSTRTWRSFTDRYGVPEDGNMYHPRSGTYAIIKEVEAARLAARRRVS